MRNVGNQPIYLDYNATTPLAPEVVEVMRPFLEREFGNPSSSHHYGEHPRQAVTQAREQVAALIGAKPEDIVFTSGGTESNNYAIIGTVAALKSRGSHVITTNIEHPAVANTCAALVRAVTVRTSDRSVPPDHSGSSGYGSAGVRRDRSASRQEVTTSRSRMRRSARATDSS